MEYSLGGAKHILILGAGASVDYGLPTWKDLSNSIKEKINTDKDNHYQNKKEILAWVDKIGEERDYGTIDECITKESVSSEYHLNGHEIENQIFLIVGDVFNEVYKTNDEGWIRKFNEKILFNRTGLENDIGFINYNYDNVLDRNFLDFTYLPAKHQRLNYKGRLAGLSKIMVGTLHPHGYLFSNEDLENTHIKRTKETMKSSDPDLIDAVSCHESHPHTISNYSTPINLYILGLGGGLQINLDNIYFKIKVSKIHITIRDEAKKSDILEYLSEKYKISPAEIQVYGTCEELVQKCF